jgi:predicted translin family RNA/ssDNA-binding protein
VYLKKQKGIKMTSAVEELANELVSAIASLNGSSNDEANEKLDEAKEILKQLNREIMNLNADQRKVWREKHKGYERQINDYQKKLLTGGSGGAGNSGKNWADDPRREIQESHDRQMEKLKEAQRQLVESEQVATGTLENLAAQKEKLQKVSGNLDNINDDLNSANKLLNKMNKWWRG